MATYITKCPSLAELLAEAKATYRQHFGKEPVIGVCAPGRVNLIGEHLDYNDGFVLPMALSMVTLIVGDAQPGDVADIITCCAGADEPKHVQFKTTQLQPGNPKWANYVKGVLASFGRNVEGFNAVIISNVPVGGGLSSSAALEVATLTFVEQLTGKKLESNGKRALICQEAEHKFVGMPCGIMDQMVSVSAVKDNALLLDCRSLETYQIPFAASNKQLIVLICNSGVRHELSQSEYPTRRKQCDAALNAMGLKSYRDANEHHLAALQQSAKGTDVLVRRARHVITEIKRTQAAAEALKANDFAEMGKLMNQSHASLRDDFEVSCKEIDVLVAAAQESPHVLGSRMTGGGFGGCTVTLVEEKAVESVIAQMRKSFCSKFGEHESELIEFYTCTPSTGARHIAVK